jgi:enoyl-CoA hydratase/carnithine racemase
MEMMLLGEPMAAERAYQVGLVNRVVPAGELLSAALDYANRLADNAPMVMAMLKRFVGEVVAKGPSERAALARAQVDAVTASADFAEGKAAFAAKRKPDFKGK